MFLEREALRDLERAEAGGGPRERIGELREQIRTVADEVARTERTERDRIDQARLRMEQGSLDAGRVILAAARKNDPQVEEIKQRIDARDKEAIEMVVIRLARGGAKKRPFYNIVVADSRERRDGRFIERVGFYNPMAAGGEQPLRVAIDRVGYWTGVGARLSPTVSRLVDQAKQAA